MAEAKPAGINVYIAKQRQGDSELKDQECSVFMVPAAGLERQVEGLL